eukprot:5358432-Ditylum_brightwellii.AAC.1
MDMLCLGEPSIQYYSCAIAGCKEGLNAAQPSDRYIGLICLDLIKVRKHTSTDKLNIAER